MTMFALVLTTRAATSAEAGSGFVAVMFVAGVVLTLALAAVFVYVLTRREEEEK